MNKEYWTRKAHRYLGLFVGIQLLLWVISGVYFSWNDIEKVRGMHLAAETERAIDVGETELADLGGVLELFHTRNPSAGSVIRVELRLLLGEPVYEISYTGGPREKYQLVDARSGEFIPMIDEETAVQLARADFAESATIQSVELVESASRHAEFRGRDLPIYRVAMDHPSGMNIYVSAQRGLVTARRSSTWRVFDFLWMMHTMDFKSRDDFNNALIKALSVLSLITVLSGFLLWGLTTPLLRRRS